MLLMRSISPFSGLILHAAFTLPPAGVQCSPCSRRCSDVDDSTAVFEKTCEATQKNVKSHVSLDFEKKR